MLYTLRWDPQDDFQYFNEFFRFYGLFIHFECYFSLHKFLQSVSKAIKLFLLTIQSSGPQVKPFEENSLKVLNDSKGSLVYFAVKEMKVIMHKDRG